jgi:hypothetical protein
MRHTKRKNPRDGLHRQTKNPQKRTREENTQAKPPYEQQDLIATPWQIWERKETDEYIEPEYLEEEEETEEQGEEHVWIKSGVKIKEKERQAHTTAKDRAKKMETT